MNLNMSLVRDAVEEMPVARDAMSLWKERARGRQESSVPRIMRMLGPLGNKYRKEDVVKFLKAMDAAGAGRLVFSKGKLPRFIWDYNLKSLAKAALSTSKRWSVDRQAPPKTVLPDVTPDSVKGSPQAAQPSPVPYRSRVTSDTDGSAMLIRNTKSGFEVTLPLDLTPAQAAAAKTLLAGIA